MGQLATDLTSIASLAGIGKDDSSTNSGAGSETPHVIGMGSVFGTLEDSKKPVISQPKHDT
jgi:hypothetical protein